MKNIFTVLLILFSIAPSSGQNMTPIWERSELTDARNMMLRSDSVGNIIAFGERYYTRLDFITVKYDTDGNLKWKKISDFGGTETIADCAVDAQGDVYFTGQAVEVFSGFTRFVLVKYSADGDSLWTFFHGGTSKTTNAVKKLILDADGNLILLGSVQYYEPINDTGLLMLKISPEGKVIWESVLSEGPYNYAALDMRLIDDRYVIWGQVGSAEGTRFVLWELDKEGQSLHQDVSSPYDDYFITRNYGIDSKGNFIVGDVCCEYFVTKFDRKNPKKPWKYQRKSTYSPLPTVAARVSCVEFDADDNIYISGSFFKDDTTQLGVLTTKLNPSGEMLWEKMFYSTYFTSLGMYHMIWHKSQLLGTGIAQNSTSMPTKHNEVLLINYAKNGTDLGTSILDQEGEFNIGQSLLINGNNLYIGVNRGRYMVVAKYALPTSLVQEMDQVAQPLQVYPNPFTSHFHVVIQHESAPEEAFIGIWDETGKLMEQSSQVLQKGSNSIFFSKPDMPPGIYYISIKTHEACYTVRAIKS